jgi:ADP-dependent NAD(P)H-hydrate dehydratase / NAD(P)H-hydrate epimerase
LGKLETTTPLFNGYNRVLSIAVIFINKQNMKFFPTVKIHHLDQFTILHEPISSTDLMERAGAAIFNEFVSQFYFSCPVYIFAGTGNNGGDALVLGRLLLDQGYDVTICLVHIGPLTTDCNVNRKRLLECHPDALVEIENEFTFPSITPETILVDGLFGSGLNRPLTGFVTQVVEWINHSNCTVVSIDIPSGLKGEESVQSDSQVVVRASFTYSLQFPKLSFFLPENSNFVGDWNLLDIGIHPQAIAQTNSDFIYLENVDIQSLLKVRPKHGHKGTFGHALVIAGSIGMAGASVLTGRSALRSGLGLVTIHGPSENRVVVQSALPEAIFNSDQNSDLVTDVNGFDSYSAVAIGPGLRVCSETTEMLTRTLAKFNLPCVLDADALNIISGHPKLLDLLPENCILTPHPKEFDRLFGPSATAYDRLIKALEMAKKWGVVIVLKGAYTQVITPLGQLFINSTGNSGMATAGSGDALTGLLVGLLAQGYQADEAAKIGVYIHGTAGDLALKSESAESMIAGDIIAHFGKAFKSLTDFDSSFLIV